MSVSANDQWQSIGSIAEQIVRRASETRTTRSPELNRARVRAAVLQSSPASEICVQFELPFAMSGAAANREQLRVCNA